MSAEGFGDGVPWGVWFFVIIYMISLLALGGYMAKKNSGVTRTAKDHFLAGRNLGLFTATLSLYASCWSGYTEVGAPGEGYNDGMDGLRWVPGNVMFACFIGWMAPRIHFYAYARDYEGTADFITDRFRNHFLTLAIVFLQLFPVSLYVMGQLLGIGTTMSSMSGYDAERGDAFSGGRGFTMFEAALVFVLIMLFYEMVGGMEAIAKTDVIQASILLFGFMLYYIIMSTTFEGVAHATDVFRNCARLYDDPKFQVGELYRFTYKASGDDFVNTWRTTPPTLEDTVYGTQEEFDAWWANYTAHKDAGRLDSYVADPEVITDDLMAFDNAGACEMVKGTVRTISDTDNTDGDITTTTLVTSVVNVDPNCGTIVGGNRVDYDVIYLKDSDCPLVVGNVVEPSVAAGRLTINNEKLAGWLSYHIGSVPFIVYPHVMDRYYAAANVQVMKAALQLIHMSLWISAIPSILIGYVVSVHPDLSNIESSNEVFANFLMFIIDENWFLWLMGCLIASAAFAAYMSTADSGLMGFSSMLSLDVAKHYIHPFNDATDPNRERNQVYLGKVLSFVGAAVALVLVTVPELDFPLGDLYVWQGSFLFQTFPAFVVGMFSKHVCSWSVLTGALVGFVTIIDLQSNHEGENFGDLPHVFWSGLINVGAMGIVEIGLRLTGMHPGFEPQEKPEFCGFGPLDENFVGWDLKKVDGPEYEPWHPWWASLLVVVVDFVAIPYWGDKDEYDISYTGGIPWWGVLTIFLSACCTAVTMLQAHFFYSDWRPNYDLQHPKPAVTDGKNPGSPSGDDQNDVGPTNDIL